MKIKIINNSGFALPAYETLGAAGMDLRAKLDEDVVLQPMQRALIPTGLFIELPFGYEAQVRPRSGLANKYGITVLNAPGTLDCDYRGEIGVILINLSDQPFTVTHGERIAQMVVSKHERAVWEEADKLAETARGEKGFGSTGVK